MALISELNATTAEALTFPLPTVAMFARVQRENDLMSSTGRGRGAAHATPLDAARLIIALMATASPAQSVDCVTDYGNLVQDDRLEINTSVRRGKVEDKADGFTIDEAYQLDRHHTFEQALAAIIAGFAEERFANSYVAAASPVPHGRYMLPLIEVHVLDTALGASVRLGGHTYHYTFSSLIGLAKKDRDAFDKAIAEMSEVASKYKRGIHSRRYIETDPLRKIAAVINGREIDINNLLKQRTSAGR